MIPCVTQGVSTAVTWPIRNCRPGGREVKTRGGRDGPSDSDSEPGDRRLDAPNRPPRTGANRSEAS